MSIQTQSAPVDTKAVTGRRELHYRDVDEVLADAERLHAGGYERLGNWSLGRMAKHLEGAMNLGLDGAKFRPPLVVRVVARTFFKKKALRKMAPGFRLSPGIARHLVPDETSDAEGLDALREATRRWKTETQRYPQPFFGPLTPDEWNQLVLRHAEMHMSFLVPK
jgi:hypothetical protein